MSVFTPRLTCPDESDPHYNSNENIFVASGFGMFQNGGNCTAYAWGRLYEITGKKYYALHGNAEKWWDTADDARLSKGQTPKLGAIACWAAGDTSTSADGAGHVAVVEAVHDDGSWTASESGYNVYMFKTEEIPAGSPRGTYDFKGFIYCGMEFESEDEQEVKAPMTEDDARKLVVCDYVEYLSRYPVPDDIDFHTKTILDNGWSTDEYDADIQSGQEYHDKKGYLDAQAFVIRCYKTLLGRYPESDDVLDGWCHQITSGAMRYRDVAWDIYSGEESKRYRGEV